MYTEHAQDGWHGAHGQYIQAASGQGMVAFLHQEGKRGNGTNGNICMVYGHISMAIVQYDMSKLDEVMTFSSLGTILPGIYCILYIIVSMKY